MENLVIASASAVSVEEMEAAIKAIEKVRQFNVAKELAEVINNAIETAEKAGIEIEHQSGRYISQANACVKKATAKTSFGKNIIFLE